MSYKLKLVNSMTSFMNVLQILTFSERQKLPMLTFLMLVGMVLEMLGLSLVAPAVIFISKPNFEQNYPYLQTCLSIFGHLSQVQLIMGGLFCLFLVNFIKSIFISLMLWMQYQFIFNVQANLSKRLFRGYLHQPWVFHLQRNSAKLIQNATGEVSLFINNCLQSSLIIITEGLVLFGIVILLLWIQPVGSLITISILSVLMIGFQKSVRSVLLKWGKMRQLHEGYRIQHLQQGLGGVKEAKLLGREIMFFEQYDEHNQKSAQVGKKQKMLMDMPRLILELFVIGSLVVLVWLILLQGKSADTILPTLSIFTAAAFRLVPSVTRVMGAIQSFRYGLPIINVLYDELNLIERDIPSCQQNKLKFKNELRLTNVNYHYEDTKTPVLKNINLTIVAGTSIGFIGRSGAGKSTLVDIILGLLKPDIGCIEADGIHIHSNLRSWQDQIGYVPQNIFLTDDTLRANVAFGLPTNLIDDVAVDKAIKAAQLEEFVHGLPEGIDTIVGERGVRISGGQRQRIGIARALYHDPSILVLDEATSALDTDTEKGVMDAVNAFLGYKTLIIVAHRESTLAKCDVIYKLEHGAIVSNGARASLISEMN